MAKRATAVVRVIGIVAVSTLVLSGCMSMRDDSMMMKKDDGAKMKNDSTMMDEK